MFTGIEYLKFVPPDFHEHDAKIYPVVQYIVSTVRIESLHDSWSLKQKW